ncbi:hypothetical protein AAMO2058_000168000 [Amorphochlora amoebiformis]
MDLFDSFLHRRNAKYKDLFKIKAARNPMRIFTSTVLLCASVTNLKISEAWYPLLLALRFRGLSLSGISLLSRIGIGRGKAHFSVRYDKQITSQRKKVANLKPQLLWVDNYNDNLAVQIPKNNIFFNYSNWTAVCIKEHPFMDFTQPEANRWIDGSKDVQGVLRFPLIEKNKVLMSRFKPFENRLTTSMSCTLEVGHIPLKPELKNVRKHMKGSKLDHTLKSIETKADAPRHMTPLSLLEHNVGSNKGLFLALLEICKFAEKDKMLPVLVDVNIYKRVLKVFYIIQEFTGKILSVYYNRSSGQNHSTQRGYLQKFYQSYLLDLGGTLTSSPSS